MSIAARLIETVKKYPIIYDVSHEDHKNCQKKDKVWFQIGCELNEDGEILKKKWRNIRDSFAKYVKCTENDTGQVKKNYKNWHWAHQMEYFRPYLACTRNSSSSIFVKDEFNLQVDEAYSKLEVKIDDYEHFKEEESETAEYPSMSIESSPSPQPCMSYTEKTEFRSIKDEQKIKQTSKMSPGSINTAIENLHRKRTSNMDPIDLIFQGYAQILKQFSPKRQAYTKLKIAEIMTQQELEHLEEEES